MRGQSAWHYRPYRPLDQIRERELPYICRLAPGEEEIALEWFDSGSDGAHALYWRPRGSETAYTRTELTGSEAIIDGLEPHRDYELYVERLDSSGRSVVRLARTGAAVGTVIHYLHPEDEIYAFSGRSLCSPSLVKLPGGALLASMDVFSGGAPQNLTLLYRSDDGGDNWKYVTELFPCFWGKLFVWKNALYMLAHTTEYGSLIIGVSHDEGRTWSAPVTILPGAGSKVARGPHKAPMPVIEAGGRLHTAVDYGSWPTGGHANALLSIDSDADLLVADNWRCTDFLPYDADWKGAAVGKSGGALEGNAVVGPDGQLYNVLRYQMNGCTPSHGKALMLRGNLEEPEAPLNFHGFVDFNGGSNSKFDLLYDEPSGAYWAIVSEIVDDAAPSQRNVLSLAVSQDLQRFSIVKRLLDYRDANPQEVGFQYVSFLIDGDDILYQCRTAMNGARNFHDANYSTFHRIERFRRYSQGL
ncbi:sialidase family protein [Paenibacillus sp. HB172176]|uniref:sialidase family protein n=1 Tax=Paenibacillus sp. HB172176 TaxID=2493690 RepID=UPI00143937E6|nr:sialidase family protein [Paenibacillus sp. HB172176]